MISVAREMPRQDDVLALIGKSDAFSQSLYPPESRHPMGLDDLVAVNVRFMVARLDGRAVGCGALVLGDPGRAEIKRMFVDEAARGTGIGKAILHALEEAARQAGVTRIQLETGVENRDALTLYRRYGYHERGPFGTYLADPVSVFMEKVLPR
jgi:putative acetyltransferase